MSTLTATSPAVPARRTLHYVLWGVQLLLAFAYLAAGSMKATQPIDALAVQMNWVTHVPPWLVRVIGTAELAGALGLVLPSALRVQPVLTPVAASLLTLVMGMAATFHVMIGEPPMMVPSLVLGSLAAFVAWGRFTRAPISAR